MSAPSVRFQHRSGYTAPIVKVRVFIRAEREREREREEEKVREGRKILEQVGKELPFQ